MTSPYLNPGVQKYDPGSRSNAQKIGSVTYAQTLIPYNSDGIKVGGYVPRENMLSGAGKQSDQRRKQNPGFSL